MVSLKFWKNVFKFHISLKTFKIKTSYLIQGVMDANAMGFISLNVHSWLVLNLFLTFNLVLVSVHF